MPTCELHDLMIKAGEDRLSRMEDKIDLLSQGVIELNHKLFVDNGEGTSLQSKANRNWNCINLLMWIVGAISTVVISYGVVALMTHIGKLK